MDSKFLSDLSSHIQYKCKNANSSDLMKIWGACHREISESPFNSVLSSYLRTLPVIRETGYTMKVKNPEQKISNNACIRNIDMIITFPLSPRSDLQMSFLECGILSAMKEWLMPLPDGSLPHQQIRRGFLRFLREVMIWKTSKCTRQDKTRQDKTMNNGLCLYLMAVCHINTLDRDFWGY